MSRTSIDDLLTESRPESIETTPELLSTVTALIAATRTSADVAGRRGVGRGRIGRGRLSRWKRPIILVPVLAVVALATTAGALAYTFGGHPDAIIPINYVTASGQSVSCDYALHIGTATSKDATALREFVATHNWSGIGQKVYAEAIAHPYVPSASEKGKFTAANIDRFSFELALNEVISAQYPQGEVPAGVSSAESNCLGTLR
jgi:hypothetical protein